MTDKVVSKVTQKSDRLSSRKMRENVLEKTIKTMDKKNETKKSGR